MLLLPSRVSAEEISSQQSGMSDVAPLFLGPYAIAYNPIVIEKREDISDEYKSGNGEILEKEYHKLGYNCVYFARAKEDRLPQQLWTLQDKRDIMNAEVPIENAIAILDEGKFGHIAVVIKIEMDSLVIEEGNFIRGMRTVRRIRRDLPLGYFINV